MSSVSFKHISFIHLFIHSALSYFSGLQDTPGSLYFLCPSPKKTTVSLRSLDSSFLENDYLEDMIQAFRCTCYYWGVTASMLSQPKELGNLCMYTNPCTYTNSYIYIYTHSHIYIISVTICAQQWGMCVVHSQCLVASFSDKRNQVLLIIYNVSIYLVNPSIHNNFRIAKLYPHEK